MFDITIGGHLPHDSLVARIEAAKLAGNTLWLELFDGMGRVIGDITIRLADSLPVQAIIEALEKTAGAKT